MKLQFPQTIVHQSTADFCLCSKDHFIYRYRYATKRMELYCRLPPKTREPVTLIKDLIARSWLGQRILKSPGLRHVVMLENGDLVIVYDRIYVYSSASKSKFAHAIAFESDIPFATPLRGGCTVHPESNQVYFGEYLNGHTRNIRIFRVCPKQNKVEVAWEFTRQEIKHIHAIKYDPFRTRLWVTTGDSDEESNFYYTDDEFQTLHKFAGGDQSWRAIALLFDENGMEWGMDAGADAPANAINKLYRYDFATDTRTELATIGNPAYFAAECENGTAYLATTFEPKRKQDTPESMSLWYRNTNHQWSIVRHFDYAHLAKPGMSAYGLLLLPGGVNPNQELWLTPLNAVNFHNRMIQHQINGNP